MALLVHDVGVAGSRQTSQLRSAAEGVDEGGPQAGDAGMVERQIDRLENLVNHGNLDSRRMLPQPGVADGDAIDRGLDLADDLPAAESRTEDDGVLRDA